MTMTTKSVKVISNPIISGYVGIDNNDDTTLDPTNAENDDKCKRHNLVAKVVETTKGSTETKPKVAKPFPPIARPSSLFPQRLKKKV